MRGLRRRIDLAALRQELLTVVAAAVQEEPGAAPRDGAAGPIAPDPGNGT